MREEARRGRLEEEQRRAGDDEDVEDEPGGRGALVVRTISAPAVRMICSLNMIASTAAAKAPPARRSTAGFAGSCSSTFVALWLGPCLKGERDREEGEGRCGGDPE